MRTSGLNKVQGRLEMAMSSVKVANFDEENVLASAQKLEFIKSSKFHTQSPKHCHNLLFVAEELLDHPQFEDPDSKRGDLPTRMSRSQIEVVLQGTNQADLALNWFPLARLGLVSDRSSDVILVTTRSCCLVMATIREILEI